MKKLISIIGLFTLIFTAGCGEENEPSLGEHCDVATFESYCNGNVFVYCDNYVKAMDCGETCASLNGVPACRYICTGSKVGDVSYSCLDSFTLVESTCISGDNGVLLRVNVPKRCANDTRCGVHGTTASCQ